MRYEFDLDYEVEATRLQKKAQKIRYDESRRERQSEREIARNRKKFDRNFATEEFTFSKPKGYKSYKKY